MRVSSRAIALVVLANAVGGCDRWPRYATIEDGDDVIDVSENPRAFVDVAWSSATEDELLVEAGLDNADPRNVSPLAGGSLEGVTVEGSLRGVGWNASFAPPELTAESCEPATRSPGFDGDWAGDVDFVVVDATAAEDGEEALVLCAETAFDTAGIGWDLLVFELDECGLPRTLVEGGDPDPRRGQGLGLSAAAPLRQVQVTAGQTYGVMLAGFDAPEPDADQPYTLGLSLVPAADGRALCPLLPGESM